MKSGDKVKLRKLAISTSGIALPPRDAASYIFGEDNGLEVSVPIYYWVEGVLEADVEIGQPIRILRHSRNGIPILGQLVSSPVIEICPRAKEIRIMTANSIYALEIL